LGIVVAVLFIGQMVCPAVSKQCGDAPSAVELTGMWTVD